MRKLLVAAFVFAALLGACDEEQAEPLEREVGIIGPEAELVFEGTVYKPVDAASRDDVPDRELEQVGVAEALSVPYEGEIPVYRRNDEDGVYTPDLTNDPRGSIGESWVRWLPHDEVADPPVEEDVDLPIDEREPADALE